MEWKDIIERVSPYAKKGASFFVSVKERLLVFLKNIPWQATWSRIQEKSKSFMERELRRVRALYQRLIVQGAYTRRDLAVLFGIAILCGIILKIIAAHTVTIGFEDYKVVSQSSPYDIKVVQKRLVEQGGVSVSSDVVSGGACSE